MHHMKTCKRSGEVYQPSAMPGREQKGQSEPSSESPNFLHAPTRNSSELEFDIQHTVWGACKQLSQALPSS